MGNRLSTLVISFPHALLGHMKVIEKGGPLIRTSPPISPSKDLLQRQSLALEGHICSLYRHGSISTGNVHCLTSSSLDGVVQAVGLSVTSYPMEILLNGKGPTNVLPTF